VPAITTEIAIAAPPQRVWEILMDFASYPGWNPFVTSIEGQPAVGERLEIELTLPTGRTMHFKPDVVARDDERLFQWLGKVGIKGIFDGRHSFRLTPTERGIRFEQSERFSGLLGWMMFGKTRRDTEAGFRSMNDALKERAEA
jgi:hypothetical protein